MRKAGDVSFAEISRDREGITWLSKIYCYLGVEVPSFSLVFWIIDVFNFENSDYEVWDIRY